MSFNKCLMQNNCDKEFKSGLSKFCGREPLKNLKGKYLGNISQRSRTCSFCKIRCPVIFRKTRSWENYFFFRYVNYRVISKTFNIVEGINKTDILRKLSLYKTQSKWWGSFLGKRFYPWRVVLNDNVTFDMNKQIFLICKELDSKWKGLD